MSLSAAPAWQDAWFDDADGGLADRATDAWRGVEAQHVVATMRLVDSLAEQEALEALLERSKPPLPATTAGQHYLLATPFRYRSPVGSRFRNASAPGVWYGAETLRTACAEIAFWRWRFVTDSAGLADTELLTEHTLFQARVQGRAIDLTQPPWTAATERWTSPDDYRATQALGHAAQARGVQWLRYASVRDAGGACCAVFDPRALGGPDIAGQQTWHCHATRRAVRLVHGADRFEWTWPEPPPT